MLQGRSEWAKTETTMAMLAQFLGEETVARMSADEVERTCDILHAEMLKSALRNEGMRKELAESAAKFAAAAVRAPRGGAGEPSRGAAGEQVKELQELLRR
jgi:hypothetical protein